MEEMWITLLKIAETLIKTKCDSNLRTKSRKKEKKTLQSVINTKRDGDSV